LIKQFWLGLTKLLAGGILVFRFGWHDPGPEDLATIWYKKCTLRLFSMLHDLFEQVREVKSDYFNALQSSFYVCCSNFKQEHFQRREIAKLLGTTFNYLLTTSIEDPNDLEVLAQVDKIRTEEVDKIISDMLDRVDKLRIINIQSRRWHQQREAQQEDSKAVVFLAPVSSSVSDQELTSAFSVYGRVQRISRSDEDEVSIHFALAEQAQIAVGALRGKRIFGDGIRIWSQQEEQLTRCGDKWSCEWAAQNSTRQGWHALSHGDSVKHGENRKADFRVPITLEASAPLPGFLVPVTSTFGETDDKQASSIEGVKTERAAKSHHGEGLYAMSKPMSEKDDGTMSMTALATSSSRTSTSVDGDAVTDGGVAGSTESRSKVAVTNEAKASLDSRCDSNANNAGNTQPHHSRKETHVGCPLKSYSTGLHGVYSQEDQHKTYTQNPALPEKLPGKEATAGNEDPAESSEQKPNLHPALQSHQMKTRELITQLLKTR